MSYLGNPIVSTDFPKDTFSGNGSTTAFTMQIAPASVNSVIVVVSGITQDPSTYTISGTTLTFSAAPPTGTSNISVRHLGIAGIPNTPSAASVETSSIADGVITAAKFASGQTPAFNGIAFPATQSASADANTLDDYEEGTWTPNAYNNGSSSTWTVKIGRYTKVGNLVTCWFNCDGGNSGTAGGAMLLTGLPYADIGDGNWQVLGMVTTNGYAAGPVMMQGSGGSTAQIWTSGAAQDTSQRSYISGMFTYRS